jgi:hypothetical protein
MKNAPNIETIDKSRHAKLKVKANPDYAHAKDANLVPVTIAELGVSCGNYPVVFIQNPDRTMRPMALLGLRPGENVYYGKDRWESTYVPRMVHAHPFVIAFDDRLGDDSMVVTACLDKNSAFLTSEGEGLALYTETGEETRFLTAANQMLLEIYESEKATGEFMRQLDALGLIEPLELGVKPEDAEARRLTGMFSINENKLRELDVEQLKTLQKQGYLPACYMLLSSMFQLPRLLRLRNLKGGEQIVDYRTTLMPGEAPAA